MSIARWTPRAMTRIVAAAVIIVGMSLALGTRSSASEQDADATLTYACPFPSGDQRVAVKVTGVFPAAETVGRSVQPRDVEVTPRLPHAALADLTGLDATSVTASADLSVAVAQNGHSSTATWSGLAAPSTPIPGSGDLALPASGPVPPTTAGSAGLTTFIAGPLTLVLTPHRADGGATNPATVPLNCTLDVGPDAVLATVPVTVAGDSGTSPSHDGRTRAGSSTATPADDDPCVVSFPNSPTPGEAYMAGFSNVHKLGGSTLIGRENGQTTGHVTLELGYQISINQCTGDTHIYSRASLDDDGEHKLPPATATFLTFGFMPTTATLELTSPEGTDLEIDSHGYQDSEGNYFEETTITSQLVIRIHDVLVNGTPLDVGPHCESATPMPVTLTGELPDYEVNLGGPLTGTVKIPPFSGCGVGEDLDPLFTGSISGPDNYMKLIQGVPCTRPTDGTPPQNCDPIDRPDPRP
ncbi:DUF6801 domain-containing protein [Actinoallomurus acaciae]|uniref:DUF6801 domain-containing protein n=1 Tax=Actinoallomurus acaciae TaxID=502577 RepID=A0ABV5YHF9_9ACTN